MTNPIRTVIVDDHPVVVAGVRALIETSEDIVCIGDAQTGAGGLDLVAETEPDVLVLDVTLPDMNGLDVAERVIEKGHRTQIVMMTLLEDSSFAQRALKVGAKGYIQKSSAGRNLLHAVRSAAMGGLYLDPATARGLGSFSSRRAASCDFDSLPSALTEREQSVLRMVALGYSNKEIAWHIKVSIKSVETYKARATEKLKLRSRAQIVRFAVAHGWLTAANAERFAVSDSAEWAENDAAAVIVPERLMVRLHPTR